MTYTWHDEYQDGNTLIPKDEDKENPEQDDEIYLEDYYEEEV